MNSANLIENKDQIPGEIVAVKKENAFFTEVNRSHYKIDIKNHSTFHDKMIQTSCQLSQNDATIS